MKQEKDVREGQEMAGGKNLEKESEVISYRLKCAKTANGLSHFVMYGDVPEDESPV